MRTLSIGCFAAMIVAVAVGLGWLAIALGLTGVALSGLALSGWISEEEDE